MTSELSGHSSCLPLSAGSFPLSRSYNFDWPAERAIGERKTGQEPAEQAKREKQSVKR